MSEGHHHVREKSAAELRASALEAVLVEKGLVSTDAIDAVVEQFQNEIGPRRGARMVARAWLDEEYRRRLLADATSAAAEMGYGGAEGARMICVENTPQVHNAIVCTLCSCYPWPVLGVPPVWYQTPPYRSRIVREPRAVLEEFGLELPEQTQIRVWDSSAEVRYIVLPMRPQGSDGLDAEQLAALVSRDCMIGVAVPRVSEHVMA
jgi:nitrile hydratase